MDGLDLLGAAETLSNQYITIRVRGIDRVKLQNKLGGGAGTLASGALTFVDASPKAALDVVVPIIAAKAKEYGVDAEIVVSNVPASKGGRAISEFWPALGIGIGIGGASLAIVKLFARLIGR